MKTKFWFWFWFHTQNCLILGMGLGFHTHIFWGFGCWYETHTKNPNPYFFACECMRQTHDLFLVGLRFLLVFIVWKEIRLDGKKN